jgi:hypothetical protein
MAMELKSKTNIVCPVCEVDFLALCKIEPMSRVVLICGECEVLWDITGSDWIRIETFIEQGQAVEVFFAENGLKVWEGLVPIEIRAD